ncbi:MAG: NUDIX hydrolase [Candidatus Harrisonbacteria bacterium]|nr:NUDIX hydrolase [Candidatus Harrisonbacteria bacterium]
MNNPAKIIYCADVIARYGEHIVIVERLGSVKGLALPGGKQDPGETLSQTVKREFLEETGLELVIEEVLGTRAEDGRDLRGRYVSTIFLGTAHGVPRDEVGKTRVKFFDLQTLAENRHLFVFDHAIILEEYRRLVG